MTTAWLFTIIAGLLLHSHRNCSLHHAVLPETFQTDMPPCSLSSSLPLLSHTRIPPWTVASVPTCHPASYGACSRPHAPQRGTQITSRLLQVLPAMGPERWGVRLSLNRSILMYQPSVEEQARNCRRENRESMPMPRGFEEQRWYIWIINTSDRETANHDNVKIRTCLTF